LNLKPDELKVIDTKTRDDLSTFHLKISSPSQARVMYLFLEPGLPVVSVTINGKRINYDQTNVSEGAPARDWELRYDAVPPEGFDLVLETKTPWPVKLTLVSQRDGLPQIPGTDLKERPAYLIPSTSSDMTRLIKSFRVEQTEIVKSEPNAKVPQRNMQHAEKRLAQ
jgi:hypothetical protein